MNTPTPTLFRALAISLLAIIVALPVFSHPPDRFDWAISDGDHHTMISTSNRAHRAVERLESEIDTPFIWLRRNGQEYVITDQATVRRARAIFEELDDVDWHTSLIEIDTDELERELELEIEQAIEEQMKGLEEQMRAIEKRIEAGSFDAIREIRQIVEDLDLEQIEEIVERVENRVGQIEVHADQIEAWAEQLEDRIENEAIPLFEDAIESGVAKPIDR